MCRLITRSTVIAVLSLLWSLRAVAGNDSPQELEDHQPAAAVRAAPQRNPMFALAHRDLLKKARSGRIDVYFLGDSITRRWHGNDYPEFQKNWKKNFWGWNAANFGWGADTTQNALWRLEHGELDGVHPKVIVLMIGTNNVGESPADADEDEVVDEVTQGIKAIIDLCRRKAPDAKIVLMAITPRNDKDGTPLMPTINRINDRIAKFADGKNVRFLSINDRLADRDGRLHDGLTVDGLHLYTKGYQAWADALQPILTERLGPPAKVDKAPPPTGPPEAKSK